MGDKTGISWCDATWNPVRGCSRVSEGCRNCYAERVAARFSDEGQPYHGLADRSRKGSKWTGVVRLIPEHLADPLRWKKPRRIFVNSMSDLFHESLTNEQIAAVFGVMAVAPQHTFQVLTKRARRMREWFEWIARQAEDDGGAWTTCLRETISWLPDDRISSQLVEDGIARDGAVPDREPWPLPNVWIGVSVENQDAADERIPELLRTPAAVRFLSCEPLLGEVRLQGDDPPPAMRARMYLGPHCAGKSTHNHSPRSCSNEAHYRPGIDWVIAGCESGPGARPCSVEWLRSLRDQCAAAGVPYFLKQAVRDDGTAPAPAHFIDPIVTASGKRLVPIVTAWTGSKRKSGGVIELPYLDGEQHAAFPEVARAA